MSWWLSNSTLLIKSTQCLGPLSIWQCFFSTGECWRCRAIYDSRASWSWSRLDEWGKIASRSCLPPPSLHSKLTFQVKSKGAKLLPRLLFDQWAQSRSLFTLNMILNIGIRRYSFVSSIEHIDINAAWNRWTGKHFVELFSKEEKQRQLKKLLVKTAKWVMRFTNFTDQTVLSIFQNFYKSFDRLIPRSSSC